jgi:hypothetical protein
VLLKFLYLEQITFRIRRKVELLRKTVSGIMLFLLLVSTLTLAFKIQPVKAEGGTIYIKADGSIDTPTAPIVTEFKAGFFTFGDIIIFSYKDGLTVKIYNSTGTLLTTQPLNRGEHYFYHPGAGVFYAIGNQAFSVLVGDPVTHSVMGYFAADDSYYGVAKEFYTYVVADQQVIVFAYSSGTTDVTVEEWDGTAWVPLTTFSLTGPGEHYLSSAWTGKYLYFTSNQPISVECYSDRCFAVPAESGLWAGTHFYLFAGWYGGGDNIHVHSYKNNNNVTVKYIGGSTIWTGTLNDGEWVNIDYSTIGSSQYVEVTSTDTVTVTDEPYWTDDYYGFLSVPDQSGTGVGTKFYTYVRGLYDIGSLWVFAYNDGTNVEIKDMDDEGTSLWTGTLDENQYYQFIPPSGRGGHLFGIFSDNVVSMVEGTGGYGAAFVPLYVPISIPSALDVSPMNLTASVDQTVLFAGTVVDQNGNGLPYVNVGIEDPISEVSTSAQTNSSGQFTYSVKANRPGEFEFRFFVGSLEKTCTIQVQLLEERWGNQSLTVYNNETDSYSLEVFINSNLIGNWILAPYQEAKLWEAVNAFSSNLCHIIVTNLRTNDAFAVDAKSLANYNDGYILGVSDIPKNPRLADYKILTTDACFGQTSSIIDPESHTFCDPNLTHTTKSAVNPLIKTEIGITHGANYGAGGDLFVGCSEFYGYKAECSASCGAGAGLELTFKLGLAFPIQPFSDVGCGWGCKVSFADVFCGAQASISAQAGYEVKGGIDISNECPVNATVYDPIGRQAGCGPEFNYTTLTRYIPGANYTGPLSEPQSVYILAPLPGNYRIALLGTDNGTCTTAIHSYGANDLIIDSVEWQTTVIKGEQYEENIRLDPDGMIILPHNLRVTNVRPLKTIVGQGFLLNITVTAANHGDFTETFNVTIYANATYIGSQNITLTKGASATITFTWNTAGFAKGNYIINAYAWPVQGEIDTEDNNRTGGTVLVNVAGDISGPGPPQGVPDGIVNIRDINYLVQLFMTRPPNWRDPNADINGDLVVNIRDIYIVVQNFNKRWP